MLIDVRKELTECAHKGTDMMQAPKVKEIIEFNLLNREKLKDVEK